MSTAKEKFELAQQRYAATFERHLDNGVNFISRDVLSIFSSSLFIGKISYI